MKPTVHILATCRKPDLSKFTELVFDTLRIGFPTAKVVVHYNKNAVENCPTLRVSSLNSGCSEEFCDTIHHEWIERLVKTETRPFFILDTDIIFFDSFERFDFTGQALAGFRVPEWQDEFSGAITRARLHGSLMYIDPVLVKHRFEKFKSVCPDTPFTPFSNPYYPMYVPLKERLYFYDTMALMYHAIGGKVFTDEQKNAYFHFNFGTMPDLVLPRLSNAAEMEQARNCVMENRSLGHGAWRVQEEYYAARPVQTKKETPLPSISEKDAAQAKEWNFKLCLGDTEAMQASDLWYRYCHGIDDLLDTMEDGRPTMSREQILELFILAAGFYNSPFYRKYQTMLLPTVLLVTNAFADSVAWERSSISHRRTMGDCLRTCGDEMYYMIAMLKGGWKHMRDIGPAIRERDWIGQHDKHGNPT